MFDISMESKIDILIILLSIWVLVFIFGTFYRIKLLISGNDPDRIIKRIQINANKGNHSVVVELADWFLGKQPEHLEVKWYKARALYKLAKYQDAKKAFEWLAENEPMWAEDSAKYIQSINKKDT